MHRQKIELHEKETYFKKYEKGFMRKKSSFRFVKSKFIRVNSDFICEKSTRKWYSLIKMYNQDFMKTLMEQPTDAKDRYKPIKHNGLQVGDIVLLLEPLTKPVNHPIGIVESITINELGEVTRGKVRKGSNRELGRTTFIVVDR